MKGAIVTLLAAAAGIAIAQLPATAQNRVSSKDETSRRQRLTRVTCRPDPGSGNAAPLGHVASRYCRSHGSALMQ